MLLLLRCCVLRYASAAAVAVYVAVAAAASGVGSGASVRTLRQFAPASFGGVLLLPEGGWPGAQHHSASPSGGFEGRPRCCCHGPAYALLRVALAGPRRVCWGGLGGGWSPEQAPTHRPHAFEAALAYPPWRWLTLPIGASAISSVVGSCPILANVLPVTAGCPGTVRCLWSWCSSWPTGRVGRFFPRSVSL